jgi:hypothetical protein
MSENRSVPAKPVILKVTLARVVPGAGLICGNETGSAIHGDCWGMLWVNVMISAGTRPGSVSSASAASADPMRSMTGS